MADGRLEDPTFSNDATVVKYLVPQWYPDVPAATLGTLDTAVSIDDAQIVSKGAKVYYASVFLQDGKIHLTNSRSFGVLSRKPELTEAEETAESACNAVKGPVRHRKDIGKKELVQKKVDHMAYLRS
jgi:phosphoribosylamine--glycine ligase